MVVLCKIVHYPYKLHCILRKEGTVVWDDITTSQIIIRYINGKRSTPRIKHKITCGLGPMGRLVEMTYKKTYMTTAK